MGIFRYLCKIVDQPGFCGSRAETEAFGQPLADAAGRTFPSAGRGHRWRAL